ncbi:type II toxin-antitoxin system VapC family toxin [Rhodocaloribacter sp.]
MLCITDANIWIDLDAGRLLRHVFALAITWATPDIILEELNTVDVDWLLRQGVTSHPLSSMQVEHTAALAARYRRPSEADLAALVLAADKGAVLVTGDGALREAALQEGVVVHGVLWLLDRMIATTVIDASTAADGLQRMLDNGARLPRADVDERLRRWRDS